MRFPYEWWLSDGYPAKGIESHNCKVFGTFICGGGSSMGYKLAGYEHLGGVEIDPQVADIYEANHGPQYLYQEDIRQFNKRTDLPEELYDLDLLDGSPPCSSFSMAGNRDKDWGKEKKFREGQANQRLDDLVYIYIDTIKKLQPKVAVLENVKGLIQGNAKAYAKKMKAKFEAAGYKVQVFLLNAASMGVPQKRERVFFIGIRKDFNLPRLSLEFKEPAISFSAIENKEDLSIINNTEISKLWIKTKQGKSFSTEHPNGSYFNDDKVDQFKPINTITSDPGHGSWHYAIQRRLCDLELKKSGSYPIDYNFRDIKPKYLIGMSVPPVMTAQISNQIYRQWLKPIKEAA